MKKIISLSAVFSLFPVLAFAQTGPTAFSLLSIVAQILSIVLPILVSLAVVYFIWGVVQYVSASADEQKKEGRAKIINGLIGLFVIIAFWGIIFIFRDTFGFQNGGLDATDIPCVPNPALDITCPN